MSEPVTLTPEAVETVARRVAELLTEQPPTSARLVDAHELAALLGVSRATVYEHAERLGALRLGSGARPRLRFNAERALAAWQQREREPKPEPATPRRRTPRTATPLLPIRGDHERRPAA